MTDQPPDQRQALPPPRLDEAALARLRELDPDGRYGVVTRVLTAFETSLTRMLAQLQAELDNTDGKVVADIAHTLKSSSASVGALDLARASSEVERLLRDGTAADPGAEVRRMIRHSEEALRAVGAMLRP